MCKVCKKLAKHLWRTNNMDRVRAYQKQWIAAHPENVKTHNRTHYANLSDAARQKRRTDGLAWNKAHPEHVKRQRQLYRQRHPDKVSRERREFMRRKRHMAPEATRAYERAYRAAHRERFAERQRRYYLANPELWLAASRRRKARKRLAPVVEAVSKVIIYQRDKGICSLCHQHVAPADASLDHIIPLSKGGEHSYRNMALAHLRCNLRKNNRPVTQQMRLF